MPTRALAAVAVAITAVAPALCWVLRGHRENTRLLVQQRDLIIELHRQLHEAEQPAVPRQYTPSEQPCPHAGSARSQ